VTFEALLKSAMRQDPDVLFLGEVRDPFSARAVLDFASSGHLTISTLHSSNATTAIFRLERLGIERGAMADSIAAIIAQKLLKRLCQDCKEIGPINATERAALAPYMEDPPATVARPRGCPSCRGTGFRGREGVFEVLLFDREAADRVRGGVGIAELRSFCAERGDYLVSHHALEKVRQHIYAVQEVVDEVLLEESVGLRKPAPGPDTAPRTPEPAQTPGLGPHTPTRERSGTLASGPGGDAGNESPPSVLLVDDDEDLRALVALHLEGAGYRIIAAADGVDALMTLAHEPVDVILSDVNMPNLDGLKLMEILHQKGIETPIIFLTATDDEDTESLVLGYGAADYIRKPVRKEVLLLRVGNALRARGIEPIHPAANRP
jgi:CheY-like chemotaxis protein